MPAQKRILELNGEHEVFKKLANFSLETDKSDIENFAHLLYGQALIAEGAMVPDPAAFAATRCLIDVELETLP